MSERTARKGSYWARKQLHHDEGDLVRVVVGRSSRGDDRWGAISMVCFVWADDPQRGGMLHEEDFRADYVWVRGR